MGYSSGFNSDALKALQPSYLNVTYDEVDDRFVMRPPVALKTACRALLEALKTALPAKKFDGVYNMSYIYINDTSIPTLISWRYYYDTDSFETGFYNNSSGLMETDGTGEYYYYGLPPNVRLSANRNYGGFFNIDSTPFAPTGQADYDAYNAFFADATNLANFSKIFFSCITTQNTEKDKTYSADYLDKHFARNEELGTKDVYLVGQTSVPENQFLHIYLDNNNNLVTVVDSDDITAPREVIRLAPGKTGQVVYSITWNGGTRMIIDYIRFSGGSYIKVRNSSTKTVFMSQQDGLSPSTTIASSTIQIPKNNGIDASYGEHIWEIK